MNDIQVPFVPDHIKEPKVFYDRKRGMMMLLGKWRGELWLFEHNAPMDYWQAIRRATDEDVETISNAMRQ